MVGPPLMATMVTDPAQAQPLDVSISSLAEGEAFELPVYGDTAYSDGVDGEPVGYARGDVKFTPGGTKLRVCVAQTAGDPGRLVRTSVEAYRPAVDAEILATGPAETTFLGQDLIGREQCDAVDLPADVDGVTVGVSVSGVMPRTGPGTVTLLRPYPTSARVPGR